MDSSSLRHALVEWRGHAAVRAASAWFRLHSGFFRLRIACLRRTQRAGPAMLDQRRRWFAAWSSWCKNGRRLRQRLSWEETCASRREAWAGWLQPTPLGIHTSSPAARANMVQRSAVEDQEARREELMWQRPTSHACWGSFLLMRSRTHALMKRRLVEETRITAFYTFCAARQKRAAIGQWKRVCSTYRHMISLQLFFTVGALVMAIRYWYDNVAHILRMKCARRAHLSQRLRQWTHHATIRKMVRWAPLPHEEELRRSLELSPVTPALAEIRDGADTSGDVAYRDQQCRSNRHDEIIFSCLTFERQRIQARVIRTPPPINNLRVQGNSRGE